MTVVVVFPLVSSAAHAATLCVVRFNSLPKRVGVDAGTISDGNWWGCPKGTQSVGDGDDEHHDRARRVSSRELSS